MKKHILTGVITLTLISVMIFLLVFLGGGRAATPTSSRAATYRYMDIDTQSHAFTTEQDVVGFSCTYDASVYPSNARCHVLVKE